METFSIPTLEYNYEKNEFFSYFKVNIEIYFPKSDI